MKFTNKQIAAAFRRAKEIMWDGTCRRPGEEFLCIALVESNMPAMWDARRVVESRLEGYETFYTWLASKTGQRNNRSDVQVHKLRWVDMLINEFETKKAS